MWLSLLIFSQNSVVESPRCWLRLQPPRCTIPPRIPTTLRGEWNVLQWIKFQANTCDVPISFSARQRLTLEEMSIAEMRSSRLTTLNFNQQKCENGIYLGTWNVSEIGMMWLMLSLITHWEILGCLLSVRGVWAKKKEFWRHWKQKMLLMSIIENLLRGCSWLGEARWERELRLSWSKKQGTPADRIHRVTSPLHNDLYDAQAGVRGPVFGTVEQGHRLAPPNRIPWDNSRATWQNRSAEPISTPLLDAAEKNIKIGKASSQPILHKPFPVLVRGLSHPRSDRFRERGENDLAQNISIKWNYLEVVVICAEPQLCKDLRQ